MKYFLYIILILFVSNLDIYLFRQQLFPFRPSELLIPAFVGLAVISFHPRDYLKVFKTHTFKFFLVFALLATIYATQGYTKREAVMTDIVNSVITLLLYAFTLLLFIKSDVRVVKIFLLISLLLLSLSLWYDMFVGLDKLNEELRKGGFAENPNTAASAMKFVGLCLLYLYRDNKQIRLFLLIVLVSSIFLTFSRSGIIGVLILTLLLLVNEWKSYYNFKIQSFFFTIAKGAAILTITYFVLVNLALFIQKEIPEFNQGEAGQRIDLLLGKTSSKQKVNTGDDNQYGRKQIAIRYLNTFMSKPFGSGTGYTSDKTINYKDTHNYYLKAAVDFGIFGIFVLLIFLFYSIRLSKKHNNFYYLVFILMLMFECLISHGLFMEKAIIVVIAFMDSRLYFNNEIEA